MVQEDKYERQRANTHWYKDDDLNTKKFHTLATTPNVNQILSLKNDIGDKISYEHGMCQVAKGYFEHKFLLNNSVRALVIDAIETLITSDDNNFLIAPFSLKNSSMLCSQCI